MVKKNIIYRNFSEDESEFLDTPTDPFFEFADPEEIFDIKNVVLRDTSEKKGWYFTDDENIECTEKFNLNTGDYTIKGLENEFIIERKGSTAEFAHNITEKRFEQEMVRLDDFKWPFLVCEFTMDDLKNFPVNSGIPPKLWNKVRITKKFLISSFLRYQIQYKTKFILAGKYGMDVARGLFKLVSNAKKQV